MEKKSYVYVILDKKNEALYIGKANDPYARFQEHLRDAQKRGHKKHLYAAMKSRPQDFVLAVVMEYSSEQEAYDHETIHIREYKQQGKIVYNLNDGGRGQLNPSPAVRRKLSLARLGKPLSPEHCLAISKATTGEGNPMHGRKHSPESIEENAESNRRYQAEHGNAMQDRHHTEESIELMREKATGRLHSDETKQQMSEDRKGEGNSFFGKKHTLEARRRMGMRRHTKNKIALANLEQAPADHL